MSSGASELSRAGRSGRDDRTAAPGLTRTRLAGLAGAAVIAVGIVGVYRYVENYWLYRGFAPPHDAAFVKTPGATERFYLPSRALGGRRQPVDVYLPPGYRSHPDRRYPVMYLLHGFPGRPDASSRCPDASAFRPRRRARALCREFRTAGRLVPLDVRAPRGF